jgi:translation initiation factor 5B
MNFPVRFVIRQPIISVMGHVDHGKTTLLDKIRSTTVAAKEAGGITQHIGASEVPISIISRICGKLLDSFGMKITIPGLLFIDTPGHEAFTNLRKRGGSVSDMAIVVVDIMKGFEPQTIEAIEILKSYKTPFIVAANKIDLITGWINSNTYSYMESIKKQNSNVSEALTARMYELVGRLSELGFNSDIFTNVKDFQKELAIVPISAKTGEGVAELLMLVTGLSQKFLEAKLTIEVDGPGRGSILERKEIKGLGTTIDVILYDGTLRINDIIAFATDNGVKTTKIKALLKPKPLTDIRDSQSKFVPVDVASAACGVKISANDLEGSIAGSPIIQVVGDDYASQIDSELGDVFKADRTGPILKADSIGSIEAITKLLNADGFTISKKELGDVTKRDVTDAFAHNATDPTSTAILAFNVGVDPEVTEAASISSVKIIKNNIIYKLVDDYKEYVDQKKKNRLQEMESTIVFPGKIELLRDSCFRASHPAIFGVRVIEGRIRKGYPMMNEEGVAVGRIKEIQNEKLKVDSARKGDEIAVSMDEPTFGRQIKEGDMLYTRVTYQENKMLTTDLKHLINEDEKKLLAKIAEIEKEKSG